MEPVVTAGSTLASMSFHLDVAQQFGTNMNRLEDAIVGGWQLSSIFLWQTGPYLTPYIPGMTPTLRAQAQAFCAVAINVLTSWVRSFQPIGTVNQWVNPNAFACPSNMATPLSYAGNTCGVGVTSNPIGRFGNESVGDIEGPGTANWSAGVSKQIAITERVHCVGSVRSPMC